MTTYDDIRAAVNETGSDSRVEVNQRALIDKILARYASANAVYRELLQNSNDAEADTAEILFTVKENKIVEQVIYRNNGKPFRKEDWSRLKKIAEGNPDVSKVGAFGVGAYTMFSICEEPIILSGDHALAFVWKGDALWTKVAPNKQSPSSKWTSFLLPSRDPYPLPDLVEFGEFLCSNLTFTKCLRYIRVLVNNEEKLSIVKTIVQEPRLVTTLKSSSWWQRNVTATSSPEGTFYLDRPDQSIYESIQRFSVIIAGSTSSIDARYVSATAKTRIPSDMGRRMERVTKKQPPKEVNVDIFLNAEHIEAAPKNKAEQITQFFLPSVGAGRIFIGFRTSQTTGLAAHLAAPFVPTVEREAMDLQDAALRMFNLELLKFAGTLMRITLEHSMFNVIDVEWKKNAEEREKIEKELEFAPPEKKSRVVKAEKEQQSEETSEDVKKSTGLFGFAKLMAKGVKKSIVSVAKTVESMIDDGSHFLNPSDPRPLSKEEVQAIVLMQSFCPKQSTPDPLVGAALGEGFDGCMPELAPPVLTKSGVVRGNDALLPKNGIEAFVKDNVVRKLVFANAEEYHLHIARCRELSLQNLVAGVSQEPLENEKKVAYLLEWWTKYNRIDPRGAASFGMTLKDSIQYKNDSDSSVLALSNFLFYVRKESPIFKVAIGIPDSVIPHSLQKEVGQPILEDPAFNFWWSALPIEIWAEYVSHQPCMNEAKPEDDQIRVQVLSILCNEFMLRTLQERHVFGSFCQSLLGKRRCIPFGSPEPSEHAADVPDSLYLYSAELKAFDGCGSFRKVSKKLMDAGVTESFLLTLGVRKSVAIDFLFTNLDKLKWDADPRPLIEYLRSATLTKEDILKLASTQYLPAESSTSRSFAPSELYLTNPELRIFPFVNLLKWPSETTLSENSLNGKFLVNLGMKVNPPLKDILNYVSGDLDMDLRSKCLDFLSDGLRPHGVYHVEYSRMSPNLKKKYLFIPCTQWEPFSSNPPKVSMQSPESCFSDLPCSVMGFPVVDRSLGENAELYGSLFQCAPEPDNAALANQLLRLVTLGKQKQSKGSTKELCDEIESYFETIFKYLSQKCSDMSPSILSALSRESFIPVRTGESVEWMRPEQVFFRPKEGSADSITQDLFKLVNFSPFLAATGVRQEASTKDLFDLMLDSPEAVLKTVGGENKYRLLLRRIAANPPFARITDRIRKAPFLLGYTVKSANEEEGESTTFHLAKAEDIYVIDNSFFARMFPVYRAPSESDLEEFYIKLGSQFISKAVDRKFEFAGSPNVNTITTKELKRRIQERGPLLVSPNVSTRPFLQDAALVLDESRLDVYEAPTLLAIYTFGGIVRRNRTTCFSRRVSARKNAIYVTKDFDWFDVGYAIGYLILSRCQLEDAFFIGSILEAPLEQLKARGFPVERILHAKAASELNKHAQTEAKYQADVRAQPAHSTSSGAQQPFKFPTDNPGADDASVSTQKGAATMPFDAKDGTKSSGPDTNDENLQSRNKPDKKMPSTSTKEHDLSTGFEEILLQMFPNADPNFIKQRLGPSPTLDDVRELAEEMSGGKFPHTDDESIGGSTATSNSTCSPTKNKGGLRKKLGKAFSGFRGNSGSWTSGNQVASSTGTTTFHETRAPVPSASDAQSHANLEKTLESAVSASSKVSKDGIESEGTKLISVPEGLDRGETCEIIPGQSLRPFSKTRSGILVFASQKSPVSEDFLAKNPQVIDAFALVIERVCGVYNLRLSSVAIFHDATGGTIAFNSNRAVHFNIRFFYSLHYMQQKHNAPECYSYWFVTTAHELAHHMVSAHNKEHGFYTESYVSKYLPNFAALLKEL